MPDNEKDKQEQNEKVVNHQDKAAVKSRGAVLPALAGIVVGAVVVGAVWGFVAHAKPADPVIATVGSNQIRQSDFNKQMEAETGEQTLQQMIENQLIKDAAKAQNVSASQSDIQNALQGLEAQYGISSSDQLAQFLKQNNVTQAQLNDILTVQVLEQKLALSGVTVSDKEIQDYYNANKAQFTPQGSKTPEPLSKVKSQVEAAVKQSKATPAQTLVANLAKKENIVINDTKYASVKTSIENPSTASSSQSPGSAGQ